MAVKTRSTEKPTEPESLATVRQKIAATQEALETLDHKPISRTEAEAKIDQFLQRATTDMLDRRFNSLPFLNPQSRADSILFTLERLTPSEMEIWLRPEGLKKKLLDVCDWHYQRHGAGLATGERVAQQTELESDLQRLLVQEESAFMRLCGEGHNPSRRGEEDPRIVYEVVET